MAGDETARAWVAAGAQLVDVRTPAEFSSRHLDGARNLPVDSLLDGLRLLERDVPVVVYCRSGMRSAKAARMFREQGFARVHDMGAMSNWTGGLNPLLVMLGVGLVLLLGLLFGALSGCATTPTSEEVAQSTATRSDIDITELKARLDAGGIVLIDVRTDREWQSGHVPGALHRPLANLDPTSFQKGPVHVICASGGRSSTATDALVAAGIDAVNVLGGTHAWRTEGHPVE